MVVYNTSAKKLQVYAENTTNQSILNEVFTGTYANTFLLDNFFTSPIDGQVVAFEVLVKDYFPSPYPNIFISGQGIYNVPSYTSWTWHTFVLNNPIPVTNGGPFNITMDGPGVSDRFFATNTFYPNGQIMCCSYGPPGEDLLFRVHIQPTPGTFSWQNMH
jgi:hypothetical protein